MGAILGISAALTLWVDGELRPSAHLLLQLLLASSVIWIRGTAIQTVIVVGVSAFAWWHQFESQGNAGLLIPFSLIAAGMLGLVIQRSHFHRATEAADSARSQLEHRDRAAFEISAAGQAYIDAKTRRFIRVNRKFCEITGYTERQLLELSSPTMLHREDRDADCAMFQRLVRGDIAEAVTDARYVRHDGRVVWVNKTMALIRDEAGRPRQAIAVITDITARKNSEMELDRYRDRLESELRKQVIEIDRSHQQLRLTERMASIGTLATGIGHDLGNLILPIMCRLDAMRDLSLPKQALDHVDAIRNAMANLRRLSGGLRLFAADPGNDAAAQTSTVLGDWWPSIEPLVRRSLPRDVIFEVDLPDDLPEVAIGPHQLTHAVLNVVTNAGEALEGRPDGMVRLWFRDAPEAESILIAVADNGAGMNPEIRRRVLEPFFTTKTRSLSTGLGLSQVHSICKATGGSIDIVSIPNGGTTVMLAFPALQSENSDGDQDLNERIARISIPDQRMMCYTKALLGALGFASRSDGEFDGGGDVMLWIVHGETNEPEQVEQFMREQPDRRAVVIGSDHERWGIPGVALVDGSHQAMRAAIQEAAMQLTSTRGVPT